VSQQHASIEEARASGPASYCADSVEAELRPGKRDTAGLVRGAKVYALCPTTGRWYWAKVVSVIGKGVERKVEVSSFPWQHHLQTCLVDSDLSLIHEPIGVVRGNLAVRRPDGERRLHGGRILEFLPTKPRGTYQNGVHGMQFVPQSRLWEMQKLQS
jgi:hypothetical protein